jgi:thiol-disulfide isomerase/thioredoxin
MLKSVLWFLFLGLVESAFSQSSCTTFKLEGFINADSGKMILIPINDDSYYPHSFNGPEAQLNNGRFVFTDSILYPYAFLLGLKMGSQLVYLSGIFFIDPCEQTIYCNKDSLRQIPKLANNSMNELNNNYLTLQKPVISKDEDVYLFNYVRENPDSYVALWELINKLSGHYAPIFDSIYDNFSITIKATHTGKMLGEKLRNAKTVAVGNVFPNLLIRNRDNIGESMALTIGPYKYTLIDFWFSHCGPCIGQFKQLKSIYKTNKGRGFNIVGVSVDNRESIEEWKRIINKYKLPWKQYLDLDGKEADLLSIKIFPSNFLINKNGTIVARNIDMMHLDKFLEKHL